MNFLSIIVDLTFIQYSYIKNKTQSILDMAIPLLHTHLLVVFEIICLAQKHLYQSAHYNITVTFEKIS